MNRRELPQSVSGRMARRRMLVAMGAALGALAGCEGPPQRPDDALPPPASGPLRLRLWRSVSTGHLPAARPGVPLGAPPLLGPGTGFGAGGIGVQTLPGAGPLVRLVAPAALALRDQELVVVDPGAGRVWRIDLGFEGFVAVPGVTATPATAVALGPDHGLWLLDGVARTLLHVSRDGQPLPSLRLAGEVVSIGGFALADGGGAVLVADDSQHGWFELRPGARLARGVTPQSADGDSSLIGADAIAAATTPVGERVWLLDRRAGRVRVFDREGRALGSWGAGLLRQPVALAADRRGRLVVLDAQDRSVWLFQGDPPAGAAPSAAAAPQRFDAAQLGLSGGAGGAGGPLAAGGLALDGAFLAVSDRLAGRVLIHRFEAEGAR